MIYIKINNLKDFTAKLLAGTTFDQLELVEAQIMTHSTFSINGKTNEAFFDDSADTPENTYNKWSLLRPICYEIIKGRSLPTFFKIVMRMDESFVQKITSQTEGYTGTDIDGLFINIRYENGALSITTGTSLKTFTLDKTLEKNYDRFILDYLEQNSIDFSIC